MKNQLSWLQSCLLIINICYYCCQVVVVHSLVFLNDLPTPSFLIDIQAIQKKLIQQQQQQQIIETTSTIVPIPPISLSHSGLRLVPKAYNNKNDSNCYHTFDESLEPVQLLDADSNCNTEIDVGNDNKAFLPPGQDVCYGYIHSRVTKEKDFDNIFLAELDVPTSLKAQLVLGLNNHHVISYYWARSAGSGAAMEAPGIVLKDSKLYWESDSGFTKCNSNDGKRSEWVNFLKVNDQVQLRPSHNNCTTNEEIILLLKDAIGCDRIYGISSAGRPLGSEPIVVCEWEIK